MIPSKHLILCLGNFPLSLILKLQIVSVAYYGRQVLALNYIPATVSTLKQLAAGLPLWLIKILDHWSSNANMIYICCPSQLLVAVPTLLSRSTTSNQQQQPEPTSMESNQMESMESDQQPAWNPDEH